MNNVITPVAFFLNLFQNKAALYRAKLCQNQEGVLQNNFVLFS